MDNDKEKYYTLLCGGELYEYITQTGVRAEHLYAQTVQNLMRQQGVTSELKRKNPVLWGKRMNEISRRATAQVLRELNLCQKPT